MEEKVCSYLLPAPEDLSENMASGGALREDISGSGESDSDAALY